MNELFNKPFDQDHVLEEMLRDYDETSMQLPSFEADPHLLISKVRKHYLEYIIRLLSVNYETNQKLLGKNIYLPSAIWRCAKYMEIKAAQTCMVVELYRRNILMAVKELKADTKKGKLNRKLFECLQKPPDNEKKTQASECSCQCTCNGNGIKRKRRKLSSKRSSTEDFNKSFVVDTEPAQSNINHYEQQYQIPVLINSNIEVIQGPMLNVAQTDKLNNNQLNSSEPNVFSNLKTDAQANPKINNTQAQDNTEDEVMLQLEQLFRVDCNEPEDDLFESTLCDDMDTGTQDHDHKTAKQTHNDPNKLNLLNNEQALKIKSLDERLALLESSGILSNNHTSQNTETKVENPKHKKPANNKWLCEAYYQKLYLFEKLDEIRDTNRKKHLRIKMKFMELFGEDIDDDEIMSPLEETREFVLSCKERIAPWIVKLLTPYYVNGRIRGKTLFKSLAKHLIRLIYQCSKYASEYEVHSFVTDFLKSHKMIRCEADFRQFKIDNI